MRYRKRIVIIGILIAILLGAFWMGSRYPAIDEKAAMAGETVMGDVLSFEAALESEADDPLWLKIGHSTVNWVLTNRQGMTFGVLLATLILTLLQSVPRKETPRRTVRDIMKGVLIGAPPGVCVNCAAPIAYGMRNEGVRNETSLAVMFASPTLDIIVLAMMFSVLPLYLAVTKLVATFIFLLLILPLLLRWFFREAADGTAAVTVLGVATGYFTGVYGDYRAARDQALFAAHFADRSHAAEADYVRVGDAAPVESGLPKKGRDGRPSTSSRRVTWPSTGWDSCRRHPHQRCRSPRTTAAISGCRRWNHRCWT
jgi:hypothetical protein